MWDRVMQAVADARNVDTVMVDGTSVRVPHSAATLKKNDPRRCTGRSRGGLTAKYTRVPNKTAFRSATI